MAFVIAEPCIDVMDRKCVEECPVDCIYEGARKLYIQPDECVDCGACEAVCPSQAIYHADDLPDEWRRFEAIDREFFGREVSGLGSPGGALRVRPAGVDHPAVAAFVPA